MDDPFPKPIMEIGVLRGVAAFSIYIPASLRYAEAEGVGLKNKGTELLVIGSFVCRPKRSPLAEGEHTPA